MALKVQSSFSTGELDPALYERTDLEKYRAGLAAARNVVVGKTGRLVSRGGRYKMVATKFLATPAVIYSPPNTGFAIELGHLYVRFYNISTGQAVLAADVAQLLTSTMIATGVEFRISGTSVYILCANQTTQKFNFTNGTNLTSGAFVTPTGPTFVSDITNTTTGYAVDYWATSIIDGQESVAEFMQSLALPLNTGESNILLISVPTNAGTNIQGINLYRCPSNGGVPGFISQSSVVNSTSGGLTTFSCTDYGQSANYNQIPPTSGINDSPPSFWKSKTGLIYQQRLLLTENDAGADNEIIHASRPGFQNNFLIDYPLSAASSLDFESGASSTAQVLKMIENNGLIVFTTIGPFLNQGSLSPTNISLQRGGNWVIDTTVDPLAVPGGILFVDLTTNTIRDLVYSVITQLFDANDMTNYNYHLFQGKQIVSWAFHWGDLPCLWVVLDDGTYASFTWDPKEQMMSWTRHDSQILVKGVTSTGFPNQTLFLTQDSTGQQWIEMTVPRYITGAALVADSEAYMNHSIALMDSMVSVETRITDSLAAGDIVTVTPVTPGDYTDELILSTNASNIFPDNGGAIGLTYRFFDTDGSSINLVVVAQAGPRNVTVQPDCTWPSTTLNPRLYKTTNVVTGLSHLNGVSISIMVDGYVVASPNNNIENYPVVIVANGQITLPNNRLGAIIHVGRPIICDVETLDIDTVEQRPVLIESKTVNKVYMKVLNTRGLYAANKLPTDNGVEGMVDIDELPVDMSNATPILGNRFVAPQTKRIEIVPEGSWTQQGKVAIRQVDPVHFEILSFIPDVEDQRR